MNFQILLRSAFVIMAIFIAACNSSETPIDPNSTIETGKVTVTLAETVWEGHLIFSEQERYPIKLFFIDGKRGDYLLTTDLNSSRFENANTHSFFKYTHTQKIITFSSPLKFYLDNHWLIKSYDGNSMNLLLNPTSEPGVEMHLKRTI
ncbi:hypothetical protein [Porphyromonas sp.]|uniref:hypothetical protein n=1 Tax=Porphyromonas sp. TaxID=1924944 RepID=UPI0026DB821F|nr:hypothetical protein [Porphyromonas sp.]MDO4770877.1 hypothetical protein [Porphyromonas sp.]